MATIEEITNGSRAPKDIIEDLKKKSVIIPGWSDLEKQYNPRKHPVVTDPSYVDKQQTDGTTEKMTRITLGLQRLAVRRMSELAFSIPVKRIYNAVTDGEKEVAKVMEKILQRNRINSRNIERGNMLFAGCEVVTFWFAVEQENKLYGIDSKIKLRCKNFSPMNGDTLYPLFDEYDDLIALSFGQTRTEGSVKTDYFDTYTATEHIRWTKGDGDWEEAIREANALGKIPAIYISRPTPIWEDTSENVYEGEWSLSRNGNYLRKNSKPIVALFADEEVKTGGEKNNNNDSRSVFQYPKGSDLKYVTWEQAIDSLKFQVESISRWFFTELQLPDMSFESMKSTPMSGEARKMMFIDAQLKTMDESGRWLEAFDREINIVKAFMKIMMPNRAADIDTLQVENVITPFTISDDKDMIENLSTAVNGKALMSRKTAVKMLGWVDDVEAEIEQIQAEEMISISEPNE